jgi:hypothetical protein
METPKKYQINGAPYILSLTLEQDELLGEITSELFKECPDALSEASEGLVDAVEKKPTSKIAVSIAMNMMRVNAWVYKKKYARRILAILLVPEGQEFDEKDVPDRENVMKKYASKEISTEVINYFFTRSGAFGASTPASS